MRQRERDARARRGAPTRRGGSARRGARARAPRPARARARGAPRSGAARARRARGSRPPSCAMPPTGRGVYAGLPRSADSVTREPLGRARALAPHVGYPAAAPCPAARPPPPRCSPPSTTARTTCASRACPCPRSSRARSWCAWPRAACAAPTSRRCSRGPLSAAAHLRPRDGRHDRARRRRRRRAGASATASPCYHHVPDRTSWYSQRGLFAQCPQYKKTGVTAGFAPAGGGFSEYVRVMPWIVEGDGLVRIPDDVSFEEAHLRRAREHVPRRACARSTSTRSTSCSWRASGSVGLILQQLAIREGARVDRRRPAPGPPPARGAARRRAHGRPARPRTSTRRACALTEGRGADRAIVAAVGAGPVRDAIRATRPGAAILLFAQTPPRRRGGGGRGRPLHRREARGRLLLRVRGPRRRGRGGRVPARDRRARARHAPRPAARGAARARARRHARATTCSRSSSSPT